LPEAVVVNGEKFRPAIAVGIAGLNHVNRGRQGQALPGGGRKPVRFTLEIDLKYAPIRRFGHQQSDIGFAVTVKVGGPAAENCPGHIDSLLEEEIVSRGIGGCLKQQQYRTDDKDDNNPAGRYIGEYSLFHY